MRSGPLAAWRRLYGTNPLQLLALLGCFALAAYAALRASSGPLPVRMAVWFVAAIVAHDLVLFPLYALADRSLSGLLSRRQRRHPVSQAGRVNYVRVPLLLSGLLLLIFLPVIIRQGEVFYHNASGLDESPYLGRWLLISAALFLASALLFAVRHGRKGRGVPTTAEDVAVTAVKGPSPPQRATRQPGRGDAGVGRRNAP